MDKDNARENQNVEHPSSYGLVLKEVVTSVRDLFQSEVDLIKAELKDTSNNFKRYLSQAAFFGALLALSVFPFLAFLIVGLGDLLGGLYWLSSLIIAVACALVGGSLSYKYYKRLKEVDLSLPHTRQGFELEKATITKKAEDIKDTTRRVA